MIRAFLALSLYVSTQALSAGILEPAYLAQGIGNTSDGFTIPVKINSPAIAAMTDLYAQVQYAPLYASMQLISGPLQKVTVGFLPGVASFFAIDVRGLRETTMYRAQVNLYRADGIHLGQSSFYYTTTTGKDPKSISRTRMVLKGLKEFYDSELGLVGQGGTVAVDGTRYGADVGEAWCSEFYSWVATGSLKNISGIGHFAKLIELFRAAGGLLHPTAIPTVARRGDYLAMDTDDTLGTNHSGMFLAYEKLADGQEFVWTLEGNSGKKVRVNRRPFNSVFTALGHIMSSQI
jgi:hypothetical protein